MKAKQKIKPRFKPREPGEHRISEDERSLWCQGCNVEWWTSMEERTPFICPPCLKIKHCCPTMEVHSQNADVALNCLAQDTYGVRILDGGTSTIKISYCPFCGKEL
jgi:hypothetical protein